MTFDEGAPSSSPDIWDHFSSCSDEYLQTIVQDLGKCSAVNAGRTNNPVFNVRFEEPLTPGSSKNPSTNHKEEQGGSLSKLKSSFDHLSPESPDTSSSKLLNYFQMTFLQELVSMESSLRLPLPELPLQPPTKDEFPRSMFGIFVADEGLRCDGITRSSIDILNEEMKWQPFAKLASLKDCWHEKIDEEWESYVEDARETGETQILILIRELRVDDEEICAKPDFRVLLASNQGESEDYLDILELVRKRKVCDQGESVVNIDKYENKGSKRMRTHTSRIEQFMTSRGREFQDIHDEESHQRIVLCYFSPLRTNT